MNIDFDGLKERLDLLAEIERDLGPGRKSGAWVQFSCPFPGHKNGDSHPSLGVKDGRYFCFTCGAKGDVIAWLREYRGLDWRDLAHLTGGAGLAATPARPVVKSPAQPPGAEWQSAGLAFVDDCTARLFGSEGGKALAWLQGRGLRPDTIRRYNLGYNPTDTHVPPAEFGVESEKALYLPRGVTIPWIIGGALWSVNVRRPAGDPKYLKITGSKGALFGADNLRGAKLALFTEGELDCILASQEVGDVIAAATLGSATGGLDLATWGAYLLPLKAILACYDKDKAGVDGLARLCGHSARIHPARIPALRPGGKDLTDYHQAGGDLREWLNHTFDRLGILSKIGAAAV